MGFREGEGAPDFFIGLKGGRDQKSLITTGVQQQHAGANKEIHKSKVFFLALIGILMTNYHYGHVLQRNVCKKTLMFATVTPLTDCIIVPQHIFMSDTL